MVPQRCALMPRSLSSMALAASCSARWRERAAAGADERRSTAAFHLEGPLVRRAMRSPPRDTPAAACRCACSSSCRRVFASFSTRAGIERLEQRAEAPAPPRAAPRRSRRRGRSRRTRASSASASDGRPGPASRPPARDSASPSRAPPRRATPRAPGSRAAGSACLRGAAGSARRARRRPRSRARRRRGIPAARCGPEPWLRCVSACSRRRASAKRVAEQLYRPSLEFAA